MDLTFLFWNTNNKKCLEEISNLVAEHSIDILILAENPSGPSELLEKLNEDYVSFYPQHPYSNCKKIEIYTRFHHDYVTPIAEDARVTARNLNLPIIENLNLIALHLGDKGNFDAESQSEASSLLKNFVDSVEAQQKHKRTIIVGDFNMNPFEIGLVKANGLHAMMSHTVAKLGSRVVQNVEYDYLYNPMWSLFGDLSDDVSGTYYYKKAVYVNYHWNIFDQVLLRPSIIANFDRKSLAILKTDGKKKLITSNGLPDKNKYSDHLPIKFTFKF